MYKNLIIEDEIDTATPVKEALKLIHIDADIAKDGKQGVEYFNNGKYDLVLLDLKMPEMSGEEVLKIIRRSNPYIDIIVYTNFGEYTDLKNLINLGVNGFISKGAKADLREVIATIRTKLEPLNEEGIELLMNNTEDKPFCE